MRPHCALLLFVASSSCLFVSAPVLAHHHHHHSSDADGADETPCIRWAKAEVASDAGADADAEADAAAAADAEPDGRVVAEPSPDAGAAPSPDAGAAPSPDAGADAGVPEADAGDPDAGARDAGADASHVVPPLIAHAGEVCVEHAGMCSVRGGAAGADVDAPSGVAALVTLLGAALVARRRRARYDAQRND